MKDQSMRGKKWIPEIPEKTGKGTIKLVLGQVLTAVARECHVSADAMRGAIRDGVIEAPALQYGKRKYYRRDQVKTIVKQFQRLRTAGVQAWNLPQLAAYLGVARCVIDWHISRRNIPTPEKRGVWTPRRGTRYQLAWSPEQVAEIIRFFATRRDIKTDCYQFAPGLRELGLTATEIAWAKYAKLVPEPDYVVGHSLRRRYWKRQTLERAARAIKVARIMKGLE